MELIRRDVKMIDIQILFATSDPSLPLSYSGLTSFDYGKEVGLFESDDFKITDSCVYSDRLRSYENHSALKEKHKIKDLWYGITVNNISKFISDVFSKQIKITRISETTDQRGYSIYIVRYVNIE